MDTTISKDEKSVYCCLMRRHFLIGIVSCKEGPAPTDVADFVIAFEPTIVIAIKYCPFCGTQINGKQTLGVSLS